MLASFSLDYLFLSSYFWPCYSQGARFLPSLLSKHRAPFSFFFLSFFFGCCCYRLVILPFTASFPSAVVSCVNLTGSNCQKGLCEEVLAFIRTTESGVWNAEMECLTSETQKERKEQKKKKKGLNTVVLTLTAILQSGRGN